MYKTSLPTITWGMVERYFNKEDELEIYYEGGDAILAKSPSGSGKRGKLVVRIGHKFQSRTKPLSPALLKKIERTFGISRKDFLKK